MGTTMTIVRVEIDPTEILDQVRAIMAATVEQLTVALGELRTALEQEKAEIAAKLDELIAKIEELQIPDATLAEIESITADIRGIIETPVPPVVEEPEPEPEV